MLSLPQAGIRKVFKTEKPTAADISRLQFICAPLISTHGGDEFIGIIHAQLFGRASRNRTIQSAADELVRFIYRFGHKAASDALKPAKETQQVA
jgi:hypothetical protein